MLVYLMAIWFLSRPFGIFCGYLEYFIVLWYIFPVLVCCSKKNLATLLTVTGINAASGEPIHMTLRKAPRGQFGRRVIRSSLGERYPMTSG
jgi:hypothetical protein